MNNKAVGIVFANANEQFLGPIAQDRALASVPFCGRYRIIDFVLSNMASSGIFEIGILTNKNYYRLMEHIGSGREWDLSRKSGDVHILPPHSHNDYGVYNGKMQALGNALEFLEGNTADYVVMTNCDKIVNMSGKAVIDAHVESGADITIVYKKMFVDADVAPGSVILTCDEDKNVRDLLVNTSISGQLDVSLNVIVMGRNFLIKLIKDSLSKGRTNFVELLQKNEENYIIKGFEYDGEVKLIRSMKTYYQANMDMLKPEVMRGLFPVERPVYTRVCDEVPAKYGLESSVKNSLISDGCIIEGEVENCVLSRGVHVKKGAVVKNSIIMQNSVIGQKCNVNYVITDRDVVIDDYRILNGTETFPAFIPKSTKV